MPRATSAASLPPICAPGASSQIGHLGSPAELPANGPAEARPSVGLRRGRVADADDGDPVGCRTLRSDDVDGGARLAVEAADAKYLLQHLRRIDGLGRGAELAAAPRQQNGETVGWPGGAGKVDFDRLWHGNSGWQSIRDGRARAVLVPAKAGDRISLHAYTMACARANPMQPGPGDMLQSVPRQLAGEVIFQSI
jgi:hypothetical protein